MNRFVVTALGLLGMLGSSVAVAEPAPTVGYKRELRLTQNLLPGSNLSGLGLVRTGEGDSTLIAVSPGYGVFLNDHVEVGAQLNVLLRDDGGDNLFSPGIAPFVHFSSAPARVRLFGELSAIYQPLFGGRETVHLWGAGVDAGIELAVTPSWAVRIGPTYRYLRPAGQSRGHRIVPESGALQAFGLNWGIAAYF